MSTYSQSLKSYSYDKIRRSSTHSSMLSCRRQAIYSGMKGIAWLQQCNPLLRSFLIFYLNQEGEMMSQLVSNLCTTFRFLRVLEFQHYRNTPSSWSLPEDIDKLIHLKYLGLSDTLIDSIRESILSLSNLETLDLNDAPFSLYLPTEICKLKNLRHLIGELRGKYLRIDNMTNLQTLITVEDDTWTKTSHESLVNLRELHLCLDRESQRNFTFDSIAKLKSIQILWVDLSENHFFSALQALSHCPHLRDLSLRGKLEKLPEEMHVLLPNIESLSLQGSELVDDPMPVLEKMLNLTVLALSYGCYCGKKMECRANSFPRVEILTIETLYLEEWQVEEGALPVLTGLELINHR